MGSMVQEGPGPVPAFDKEYLPQCFIIIIFIIMKNFNNSN